MMIYIYNGYTYPQKIIIQPRSQTMKEYALEGMKKDFRVEGVRDGKTIYRHKEQEFWVVYDNGTYVYMRPE
jgi:hypothetical protein